MTNQTLKDETALTRITDVVQQYWGYSTLRPLQEEAIRAGLDHRDSLVVMPMGGGKSLCYQVPALLGERTDIVVSPLISLMKDQVDGLRACGYPAAAIHSGMSAAERSAVHDDLVAGKLRLVFVSPERMFHSGFVALMSRLDVRSVAIDEAHCVSHWGHDFRPEYRRLSEIKRRFPQASVHAFTATATERVRRDIADQLALNDPTVLVGCFDRPNLTYRIVPRMDLDAQVLAVLERHRDEATIIYCISRKDTEALAGFLKSRGVNAAYYHAGMASGDRARTQESFTNEKTDVIVATVAFGMGIDRSNVRSVIHVALPKSIEHYQQETGRAGRDGLEAECVLIYSYADVARWRSLLTRSAEEAECSQDIVDAQMALLEHLRKYCQPFECRHKHLSNYFGQSYDKENCGACDVCLGEGEEREDASVAAQKIISCVARADERFGVTHIVDVLRGGDTEMVRKWGHQSLSTYGLMKAVPKKMLVSMMHELLDQGLLDRTTDTYQTLRLNVASWEVMRGERKVSMRKVAAQLTTRSRGEEAQWRGVDRAVFESLRSLRKEIAAERGVPPFVIFSDASLRDMAGKLPRTARGFLSVQGVGEKKLAEFGERFLQCIAEAGDGSSTSRGGAHADDDAATNAAESQASPARAHDRGRPNRSTQQAMDLFAAGASIDEVMTAMGRARSTTMQYLARYIETARPESVSQWIDDETYASVAKAATEFGSKRLKPIFELLEEQVPYDEIRVVTAHLNAADDAMGGEPEASGE